MSTIETNVVEAEVEVETRRPEEAPQNGLLIVFYSTLFIVVPALVCVAAKYLFAN